MASKSRPIRGARSGTHSNTHIVIDGDHPGDDPMSLEQIQKVGQNIGVVLGRMVTDLENYTYNNAQILRLQNYISRMQCSIAVSFVMFKENLEQGDHGTSEEGAPNEKGHSSHRGATALTTETLARVGEVANESHSPNGEGSAAGSPSAVEDGVVNKDDEKESDSAYDVVANLNALQLHDPAHNSLAQEKIATDRVVRKRRRLPGRPIATNPRIPRPAAREETRLNYAFVPPIAQPQNSSGLSLESEDTEVKEEYDDDDKLEISGAEGQAQQASQMKCASSMRKLVKKNHGSCTINGKRYEESEHHDSAGRQKKQRTW